MTSRLSAYWAVAGLTLYGPHSVAGKFPMQHIVQEVSLYGSDENARGILDAIQSVVASVLAKRRASVSGGGEPGQGKWTSRMFGRRKPKKPGKDDAPQAMAQAEPDSSSWDEDILGFASKAPDATGGDRSPAQVVQALPENSTLLKQEVATLYAENKALKDALK
eukprot:gene14512-17155_t